MKKHRVSVIFSILLLLLTLWNIKLERNNREIREVMINMFELQNRMSANQLASLKIITKLIDADNARYEEIKDVGIRLVALEQQRMASSRKMIKAIGGE